MDTLTLIRKPIQQEFDVFMSTFDACLDDGDGMLRSVLQYIGRGGGKRMRPMLMLLVAKTFGPVGKATQHAAVGLELLHTASLVHDDVVDESTQRRGQDSVNADYGNKVAVLSGDYILSTALLQVSYTKSEAIVRYLAELGRVLSDGEILQLTNTRNEDISEEVYYEVISKKTAALFEACCVMAVESAGGSDEMVNLGRRFGHLIGIVFQIRDDIFDYFDSTEIGKPTGNDMAEGKLTLPAIHAVCSTGDKQMLELARKVKSRAVSADEIARLVAFTKQNGGIEYAQGRMDEFRAEAFGLLDEFVSDAEIKDALKLYVNFVVERTV